MSRLKYPEATILSVAKTTLVNARKEQAALAAFGISNEALDAFENAIRQAKELPGLTHQRIELGSLTKAKDDNLTACFQWGRELRTRLKLAFGPDSNDAKSFPAKEFKAAARSEGQMMTVMKILVARAKKYRAVLAGFGQTPEVLAQGSVLLEALKSADALQESGKDEKKRLSEKRHGLFLQLSETINNINEIGRLVFEDNPVKRTLFDSKWPARV